MNRRELATVLAALRLWQTYCGGWARRIDHRRWKALRDIATDHDQLEPLDFGEIEDLCERLNTEALS